MNEIWINIIIESQWFYIFMKVVYVVNILAIYKPMHNLWYLKGFSAITENAKISKNDFQEWLAKLIIMHNNNSYHLSIDCYGNDINIFYMQPRCQLAASQIWLRPDKIITKPCNPVSYENPKPMLMCGSVGVCIFLALPTSQITTTHGCYTTRCEIVHLLAAHLKY